MSEFRGEMKTLVQTYVELLYPDDLEMQTALFENITTGKASVTLEEMQDYVATRSSWYAEIEAVNPAMAVVHNQNDEFVGTVEVMDMDEDPDGVEVFINDEQMNEISSTHLYEDDRFWEDYDAETFNVETFEAMIEKDGLLHCDACGVDVESDSLYGTLTIECDACGNTLYEDNSEGPFDMADFYAENFNAENEIMVHQLIVPYEPYSYGSQGSHATTYIYRDEKDLMDVIWHDHACESMEYHQVEFPEYDWEGDIDSKENRAIFDEKTKNMSIDEILKYSRLDNDQFRIYYRKIPLNLEGFSVDGQYGGITNLTRNDGILQAETFNAMSFKQWSQDEMNEELHGGQNMDFDSWLNDEIRTHGNIPLREWGYEEEHDEPEHQHAESMMSKRGKVRTLSGKPHKARKLKKDRYITPEEAKTRLSFRARKGIDTFAEPFEEIGDFYSGAKGILKIVGLGALVSVGVWITKNKLLE